MRELLENISYYKFFNFIIILFILYRIVKYDSYIPSFLVLFFFNFLVLSNLLPNYLLHLVEKKYNSQLEHSLHSKKHYVFVFGGGSNKRFEKAISIYSDNKLDSPLILSTLKMDSLQKIKKLKKIGVNNKNIITSIRGKTTYLEIKNFSKKFPNKNITIVAISEPLHLQRIEKLFNLFGYKNILSIASEKKSERSFSIQWTPKQSISNFDYYIVSKLKLLNYYIFQHHWVK